MTRRTAIIIQDDSRVHASALGPMTNGKYGVYIGTIRESPSGGYRPMALLTSDGMYDTPEEAISHGHRIIQDIRLSK